VVTDMNLAVYCANNTSSSHPTFSVK
jgi:hypothetical protein